MNEKYSGPLGHLPGELSESSCPPSTRIAVANNNFPAHLGDDVRLFKGSDGHAYLQRLIQSYLPVLRLGTRASDGFLRKLSHKHGKFPKSADLRDVNDYLAALAEMSSDVRDVWFRYAPIPGGIEIDLGDRQCVRAQVTAGNVLASNVDSDTLFYRTPTMLPLPVPAEVGDLDRLDQYLNVLPGDICLLKAWLSYTIAHPKAPATTYPILILGGDQGSGKTFLCRIIQALTDPSEVGLQTFPRSERDFAIAAQQAHVLLYDNLRAIRPTMADRLCIAATGGSLTTRRLYTDSEQVVLRLHAALVMNGIHAFIDQPDLAQRSLPITMPSLDDSHRCSEETLVQQFQVDLPYIFRGLLDLIASVLVHLPTVEVTTPERVIDFSRWLAAMERVAGIPTDVYQTQYSSALNDGMLDSLLENPLAAAVMALVEESTEARWSGTPTELFETLDRTVNRRTQHSRAWPLNAIAMSKRLRSLQAGLRRQGVNVQLSRGRQRRITVERIGEGSTHD